MGYVGGDKPMGYVEKRTSPSGPLKKKDLIEEERSRVPSYKSLSGDREAVKRSVRGAAGTPPLVLKETSVSDRIKGKEGSGVQLKATGPKGKRARSNWQPSFGLVGLGSRKESFDGENEGACKRRTSKRGRAVVPAGLAAGEHVSIDTEGQAKVIGTGETGAGATHTRFVNMKNKVLGSIAVNRNRATKKTSERVDKKVLVSVEADRIKPVDDVARGVLVEEGLALKDTALADGNFDVLVDNQSILEDVVRNDTDASVPLAASRSGSLEKEEEEPGLAPVTIEHELSRGSDLGVVVKNKLRKRHTWPNRSAYKGLSHKDNKRASLPASFKNVDDYLSAAQDQDIITRLRASNSVRLSRQRSSDLGGYPFPDGAVASGVLDKDETVKSAIALVRGRAALESGQPASDPDRLFRLSPAYFDSVSGAVGTRTLHGPFITEATVQMLLRARDVLSALFSNGQKLLARGFVLGKLYSQIMSDIEGYIVKYGRFKAQVLKSFFSATGADGLYDIMLDTLKRVTSLKIHFAALGSNLERSLVSELAIKQADHVSREEARLEADLSSGMSLLLDTRLLLSELQGFLQEGVIASARLTAADPQREVLVESISNGSKSALAMLDLHRLNAELRLPTNFIHDVYFAVSGNSGKERRAAQGLAPAFFRDTAASSSGSSVAHENWVLDQVSAIRSYNSLCAKMPNVSTDSQLCSNSIVMQGRLSELENGLGRAGVDFMGSVAYRREVLSAHVSEFCPAVGG